METFEKIQVVKELVAKYFDENAGTTIGWLTLEKLSEDEKNHIINIGTSMLCTKWDIGYPGGGFVQAFVNNDLMRAIGPLNLSGNIYSPNGANLLLDKSAGVVFGMGINSGNINDPHQKSISSQSNLTRLSFHCLNFIS